MQKKVSDILPKTEILAQLAEEASELAQAARKKSAHGGGSWITAVPSGGLHGSWTTSKRR